MYSHKIFLFKRMQLWSLFLKNLSLHACDFLNQAGKPACSMRVLSGKSMCVYVYTPDPKALQNYSHKKWSLNTNQTSPSYCLSVCFYVALSIDIIDGIPVSYWSWFSPWYQAIAFMADCFNHLQISGRCYQEFIIHSLYYILWTLGATCTE